jgi:hypothetical protein
MSKAIDVSVMEKQRVRAEIASQIEDFLRRGGRIEVLTKESQDRPNSVGSIWHSNDHLMGFSD